MHKISIIDSHTAGEPTRLVIAGGPDLGSGPLSERRQRFQERFDRFRAAIVNEPRGSAVVVGALLCEPVDPTCAAGVIFFNNVGFLGMCGHGTIGLVASLAYMGRIGPGEHRIETPVGVVTARLHPDGQVTVDNVPSYRHRKSVTVDVPGVGPVTGDVAWGGNWFFLVEDHGERIAVDRIAELTALTERIRDALAESGVTGRDNAYVDHIELFEHGTHGADSRSFVLCPGSAYDRSPCGTGTSAKLACLAADGKLAPGAAWVQESVIGSRFEGRYRVENDQVRPSITGAAFVTLEGALLLDAADPFMWGIPSAAAL